MLCQHTFAQSILPTVVVEDSVAHHRATLSTTSPVQQFAASTIEALGMNGVADALHLANGVRVNDYGGLGGLKTVSVRNMGAEHTGVIYDGVPVSNCQAGKIDISRFSTHNIAALRMGIGAPMSMLSPASAEPFSGNLYLNTATPHKATIKTSYGSFNTIATAAHIGNQHLAAFIDYNHTDGNYPFTLHNGNTTTRQHRNNSRVDAVNTELNLRLASNNASANTPRHTLDTKAYYYYSDRQLPGGIIYYNNVNHERLADENFFAQSRLVEHITPHITAQVLAKYNHSWTHYFDGSQVDDGGIAMHHFRYRQDEAYASAGISCTVPVTHNRLQLAAVTDFMWNSLRTNIAEFNTRHRTTSYSTLRASYHNTHITAHASLLYTHLNEATNRHKLTPNIGLSIKPFDNRELYVRASWRQAFRLPTFNDLYYYRMGNHNLRPELTNEFNMGFTMVNQFRGLQLSATADIYHNRITDLIVALPSTFAWRMHNYGKARMTGINALAEVHSTHLFANVGYNFDRAVNTTQRNTASYGKQIAYTARHSGNATLVWHVPWLDIGYALDWMGQRYASIMHQPQYRLAAFHDHSITIGRNFDMRHCTVNVSASCKNIFDQQYEIIQYYPMPGRSFYVTTKIMI